MDRPSLHSRTASDESAGSSCSAQRLILEHILSYPGTYEIPLRTMYTINATPLASNITAPPRILPSSRPISGQPLTSPTAPLPAAPTAASIGNHAVKELTASLMAEVSQLPNQPNSLPPSFVTAFARKCFTKDLSTVDFAQALTALDYIRDLEMRRRREMQTALERLMLRPDDVESHGHDLAKEYPGVLQWYRSIEPKERKVDALYSQIYIGLRRWVLINEMCLAPFNKSNCLAMLNTVYPPLQTQQPTSLITNDVLQSMRDEFFKMIQVVQSQGTRMLSNVIKQGKRPGEVDGWLVLREALDNYLVMANSMINECSEVLDIRDPARLTSAPGVASRRKVDSGIDMSVVPRKSSTCSASSANSTGEPALEAVNENLTERLQQPQKAQYKSTTTLEKIAREFRHMTRSKTDICEIISPNPPTQASNFDGPPAPRPTGLRKMRSLSALSIKRANAVGKDSSSRPPTPNFDADKIREQRLLHQANAPKPAATAVAQ